MGIFKATKFKFLIIPEWQTDKQTDSQTCRQTDWQALFDWQCNPVGLGIVLPLQKEADIESKKWK